MGCDCFLYLIERCKWKMFDNVRVNVGGIKIGN